MSRLREQGIVINNVGESKFMGETRPPRYQIPSELDRPIWAPDHEQIVDHIYHTYVSYTSSRVLRNHITSIK